MSSTNLNPYVYSASIFTKSCVTWRQLAKIDYSLTIRWVDREGVRSHKIVVDEELDENEGTAALRCFLDEEYGKSIESVNYQVVNYLPSESFKQIGLFAESEIAKGEVINGVVGYLAEIEDCDIVDDYNDMSVIYSKLKNIQWLMLGPVSFVNASCKANVEYKHKVKLIYCTALRDIKPGEELTVFYSRHFFGSFNVNCLCPFKSHHGNPFANDPEPPKKRKKTQTTAIASTPVNKDNPEPVYETPCRRILVDKLPTRRCFYEASKESDNNESYISYDSYFGQLEVSLIKTPSCFQLESSPSSNTEANITHPIQELDKTVFCSTPVRLDLIEEENVNDCRFDNEDVESFMFQEEGTQLFAGSTSSKEKFMAEFEMICDKHKFSKVGRQDILKLFAKNLPVPNNLFAKLSIPFLPTVSTSNFENAKLCFVDVRSQIEKVLLRNVSYILMSWDGNCSWKTSCDFFKKPQVQLVLNIDGAPVFKSSKFSVWPIWVQLYNLPPKLRGIFSNLCLLAMWHGKSKPEFHVLLPRIVLELESLFDANLEIEGLGVVSFWMRSIVADMPAAACVLCMNQFNGYFSCPHCFMKGLSKNHRMLFPATKSFVLRENLDFRACGKTADDGETMKFRIKLSTPLNKIINLPWNCPIDPMHQIFLGTGKTLSKLLISLAKGPLMQKAETLMSRVKVPFDIQHRTKSLSDVQFWKAFNFKLFFSYCSACF